MIRIPSTVRFRVTAIAVVAVLLVLVAASIAVVAIQRRVLTESLDELMSDRVDELQRAIAAGEVPTLTDLGDDDSVAQVVTPDGFVLASSPEIRGEPAIAAPISSGQRVGDRGPVRDTDDPLRVLTRVVPSQGGGVIVHLAASTDDIDESVGALRSSLLVAVPSVVAVLGVLTWLLVGRTLRPVERIRATVAAIDGADFDDQVPVPSGDDEITRLARTMNEMLERIRESSERQRRFVADASHELRSPLTRMRTELEVDTAHPDTADLAATHQSVLAEIAGMQRLVDDLLFLARATETGERRRRHEAVDVADVARRASSRAAVASPAIEVHAAAPAMVIGDAGELERAVGNVVENAARYADATVRLAVACLDGGVTVTVTDDGPGIPTAERERVFERFARVDEARSADHGGAGLGLSIARDIVERHRGTIVVDPGFEDGTRVTIRLPAAISSSGAARDSG